MAYSVPKFLYNVPSGYPAPAKLPVLGNRPGGGFELMSSLHSSESFKNIPLDPIENEFIGQKVEMYTYDWFNKIHFNTRIVEAGEVLNDQKIPLHIWNSYFKAHKLQRVVEYNTNGIYLSPHPDTPLHFSALQERDYDVVITPIGNSTINATYVFIFDTVSFQLKITGTRKVPWTYLPNWTQDLRERLEWKTDVLLSYDGHEQRRKLRVSPRVSYEFNTFFKDKERSYAENLIYGNGTQIFLLPLWVDGIVLANDINKGDYQIEINSPTSDFVDGGYAIILKDNINYEVLKINKVDDSKLELSKPLLSNWEAGITIYPARAAILRDNPKLPRWDVDASESRIAFNLMDDAVHVAGTDLQTYRDNPVWNIRPTVKDSLSLELQRKLAQLDSMTGVRIYEDETGIPVSLQSLKFSLVSRSEIEEFRKLLYALSGRRQAIWLPTWQNDLIVAESVNRDSTIIDIEACGYSLQLKNMVGRKDIRIELNSGEVFCRRITSSYQVDSKLERIIIDSPLGKDIEVKDILQVSFMALSRLESDAIELSYFTHEVCDVELTFRSFKNDL